MIRPLIASLLLAALTGAPLSAALVTIDFVPVGNAGNEPDLPFGPGSVPIGAVPYEFSIGRTEVSNAQYAVFLNAVDPTGADPLELYNPQMAGTHGGIEKTGVTDGARYVAQPGEENHPVTFVSWYDTVRFANWLHNGQGTAGTPEGDTESGAYTLLGGTPTPSNDAFIVRNAGAEYFIPSLQEWYKAAFHDASAGTAGVYFDYANGSNTPPVSDHPDDDPAAANYYNDDGLANGYNDGYALSGSPTLSPLADVTAYSEAASPYGTLNQNGNVNEWFDTLVGTEEFPGRGLQGGSWNDGTTTIVKLFYGGSFGFVENSISGFRVGRSGAVPEPNSALLAALALASISPRRRGDLTE